MAIVITNNFIEINDADSISGWTGSGPKAISGFQREGDDCIGDQASQETEDTYYTIAAAEDYSNRTVFGWMRSGNPDVESTGGFGIIIGALNLDVDTQVINAAGSGYTALDVLSIAGGTGTAATITVDTVGGGGEILTATLTTGGDYTVLPSTPDTPTGGTGTGATFKLTFGVTDAVGVRVTYSVGGGDNFGHFVLGWAGFRLDVASLPSTIRNILGSTVPQFAATLDIGYSINYQSKALGAGDNVFYDRLTYIPNGTAALSFYGGTSGTPGTFADVVVADIATTAGAAYGVIRELVGAKAYEIFFGLEWGHATSDSYFSDSDLQLYINGGGSGDGGMSAGNMDMVLVAGTGVNLFKLDNFVIIGVGTVANWDFTALFETFELTNGQFTDAGTIKLPASGGTSRKVENVSFINCGLVTPSTCPITSLVFAGTTNANGALLANQDLDGMVFTTDGTGHAIYITTPGTYTYTNNSFDVAYGATGTTDAVIYNNSGGFVQINVNSGDTPSYFNGAGASTTIVSGAVTVKVTAKEADGTAVQNAIVVISASDGTGPFPYQESVTITHTTVTAEVNHTAHGMATNDKVKIRGANQQEYNIIESITKIDNDNYEYTMATDPGVAATGTVIATFVALDGLTDVNGEISTSRVYASNQPVSGYTRKSSASPFLQQGSINNTVNSSTGMNATATMVSDE